MNDDLINDSDEELDEREELEPIAPGGERDVSLGPLLGAPPSQVYSSNLSIEGYLTLRNCNSLYRDSNGCKYGGALFPEFDRCTTKGSIAPLRRFDNMVGHFALGKDGDQSYCSTLCFPPRIANSLDNMKESLSENLYKSVGIGYLWSVQGCKLYKSTDGSLWRTNNEFVDAKISSALDILGHSFESPLSVHTQHAWHECQDSKDDIYRSGIFQQPHETTAVTGLLGTLQNNEVVDLVPEIEGEQPDIQERLRFLDVPGFLCSGHTAHSNEAGRVRRVCGDVHTRILNKRCILILQAALTLSHKCNNGAKQWLLYCMGEMCYCTESAILKLRDTIVSMSANQINSPTLLVDSQSRCVLVSISSGTLLRRDDNNVAITSVSSSYSSWPDNRGLVLTPSVPSEKSFKFFFSGFFMCIPYIGFDRPPRTLISSVQSIQAVTTPYGAGTSSVAPMHISKPVVSTPFLEDVMKDTISGSSCNLPDLIPGEDLMVCFCNYNDTNEDSIMMSRGSTERGLFAYMAYSSHLLNSDEKVPEEGEYVDMENHRWWKCYSGRDRKLLSHKGKGKQFLAGGDGRGKIMSSTKTESGKLSVKVKRYCTPVSGDKIATGHGQKGVITLQNQQDMPWIIDEKGNEVFPDIVVSVTSITNRLTGGQYYEMISGLEGVREGRRVIIAPSKAGSCIGGGTIYDGSTGEVLTQMRNGKEEDVEVSFGVCRVWQMTQLTWDKQHYTHKTAGQSSIVTQTGRTAGGGIRFGEMEGHSAESSGMIQPFRELRSRMDVIDTTYCSSCEMIAQMCSCSTNLNHLPISIPHSMLVFCYSNLITSGHLTKFKVSF